MKAGFLFNLGSFWIGLHYSRFNRRICINILPTITIWITLPKGKVPIKNKM